VLAAAAARLCTAAAVGAAAMAVDSSAAEDTLLRPATRLSSRGPWCCNHQNSSIGCVQTATYTPKLTQMRHSLECAMLRCSVKICIITCEALLIWLHRCAELAWYSSMCMDACNSAPAAHKSLSALNYQPPPALACREVWVSDDRGRCHSLC
jgi:hypothetical protein